MLCILYKKFKTIVDEKSKKIRQAEVESPNNICGTCGKECEGTR